MELHIKDRIFIPQLLTQQGTFMEFNLKRNILRKVALTEDDVKKYDIVENDKEKRTEWNPEKDREMPLVVDFTQDELQYLTKACERVAEANFPDEFWLTVEKIYNAAQPQ